MNSTAATVRHGVNYLYLTKDIGMGCTDTEKPVGVLVKKKHKKMLSILPALFIQVDF